MINYKYLFFILMLFEAILTLFVFYPGHMSIDSIDQFNQAISHNYKDHHPPIMSALWSFMNKFIYGPQSFLYLQFSVLYLSISLLYCRYSKFKYSWLLLFFPLAPWIINFSGVMWKDVSMAFSMLLFFTITLIEKQPKKIFYLQLFLVFVLIFYAINVRHNAFFAALPIIFFSFSNLFPNIGNFKKGFLSLVLIVLIMIFGNLFNSRILDAEKTNTARGMTMVDDLFFLSLQNNESMIPGIDFQDILLCSEISTAGSKIHLKDFCLRGTESYQHKNPWDNSEIEKQWAKELPKNFFKLMAYKLDIFLHLLRIPDKDPFYIWQEKYDGEKPGYYDEINNDEYKQYLKKYVKNSAIALPLFFKPYFWLITNFIFILIFFRSKKNREIMALNLSSLLYIFGYYPLNVAPDFRYIYWSILATTLSIFILVIRIDYRNLKKKMI